MPSRLVELRREKQWRQWQKDPIAFLEEACYIRTPHGKKPFKLRPAQRETLETVQDNRYVIILKARQVGYSTLFACYVLWLAIFYPDQVLVFLSRGEREAISLLDKAKYSLRFLPAWVKARIGPLTKENLEEIAFQNGSSIRSLPSKKDPARGETVNLVIIDEWAFLENAEAAWASIEPITDVGGRIVGLSTANGWGDTFHTMWVRARTKTSEFVPLFYPWSANDDRDDSWYEQKAATNPEWHMAQEYPRNEDEAFLKSGRPVFDLEALAALPTYDGMEGVLRREIGKSWTFQPQARGFIELWDEPDPLDAYVLGADVAEGLEHGDYSSAHVISCRTGLVVAHWHGHVEADLFGEELEALGLYYGGALIGVEVNGHGLSTLHALRRLDYPRIYFRTTVNMRTQKQTNEIGFRTTKNTKPLIIDELAAALRVGPHEGGIQLRDEQTIAELKTYVRDEKGQMQGSPFDDRVMSLAIANHMRRYAHAADFNPPQDQYMTAAWWRHMTEKPKPGATPIGQHNVRRAVGVGR